MSETSPTVYRVTVQPGKGGTRLDRLLADAVTDLSRSRLKALIEEGCLEDGTGDTVNNVSRKVREGETFTLTLPETRPSGLIAQAIPLDIIFEDKWLIVLEKPAGLVVHPAPGNPDGTLVNALLAHCGPELTGIGGEGRPGIVHRLDKGTSGLMVVAKTQAAHSGLVEQFSRHDIERAYKALVRGVPNPHRGTIDKPIGRHPKNRKKMAVVERNGRRAVTHYEVEKILAGGAASLVNCRLETGRTHQIRVHLSTQGTPVLGDPLYARRHLYATSNNKDDADTPLNRLDHQALHAYLLGFHHPETGESLRFQGETPAYFNELADFLET
ncbi:MAG: RluA family pseudouridine synthase [Magnetovibrionaceae bacterium]